MVPGIQDPCKDQIFVLLADPDPFGFFVSPAPGLGIFRSVLGSVFFINRGRAFHLMALYSWQVENSSTVSTAYLQSLLYKLLC